MKVAASLAVILVAVLVAACVVLRIRHPGDLVSHCEMAIEFPVIWRELALRRFGPGDSAEDLTRRCPPKRSDTFGRYAIHHYFHGAMSGITVTVRDGKLLSAEAGGCTWKYSFFETADAEIDREYETYVREKGKLFEQRRIDKIATNLVVFRERFERWPTNVKEFATFVTGTSGGGTDPLSIALHFSEDGAIEVVSRYYPEQKRIVSR
jgi:hypothetical protein